MPYMIINAVLAIASIVAGVSLYNELETTRAKLTLVEQLAAIDEAERAAAVRNWHLCCEHLVQAQQQSDRQTKQLQKFRKILTRHDIEWHEEPGIVLEIAP